jgi:hypothetical protein
LDAAARSCAISLREMRNAALTSQNPDWESAVPNRYAWLADVERKRGNGKAASNLRARQQALLERLLRRRPGDLELTESWITNQTALAELELDRCEVGAARSRLQRALARANALVRADPDNKTWATRRGVVVANLEKAADMGRANSADCGRAVRRERVRRMRPGFNANDAHLGG